MLLASLAHALEELDGAGAAHTGDVDDRQRAPPRSPATVIRDHGGATIP